MKPRHRQIESFTPDVYTVRRCSEAEGQRAGTFVGRCGRRPADAARDERRAVRRERAHAARAGAPFGGRGRALSSRREVAARRRARRAGPRRTQAQYLNIAL